VNLRYLLAMIALGYFGFGLLLFLLQRSFIYMPVGNIAHDYPVEQFASGDETIEVVVLNGGKPDAVVYFGGNAEQVVANARGFVRSMPRHAVYLVNYRGYAGSSGEPSEQGLYADALNIHDRIRGQHQSVSVIGRSLGSGVATYLAANRPVERLILVTPFDSILHIAQDQYPIYPVSLMLRDRYDSRSRVGEITAQTLIVLAERDGIIPRKYSQRLIGAFPPSQVTVRMIQDTGHNGLSASGDYYSLLSRFLEEGSAAE